MVIRSIIFLLSYAVAIAFSSQLAHSNIGFKVVAESCAEDGFDTENHFLKLPSFDNIGPGSLAILADPTSKSATNHWMAKNYGPLQSDRIFQRPLYLLFHSFLFYDLI